MTGATFSGCLLSFFYRSLTYQRRHAPLLIGSYRPATNESMDPPGLTVINTMLDAARGWCSLMQPGCTLVETFGQIVALAALISYSR